MSHKKSHAETTAREIMTTELILGHAEMSLEETIKTLVNNRITGMPIVDQNKKLIGIISEYDIIHALSKNPKATSLDLSQRSSFTKEVISISESAQMTEILDTFVEHRIRRLPVVNEQQQLVGIITRRDIMRILLYRAKKS